MKPFVLFPAIVLTFLYTTNLFPQDEKNNGIFVEPKDGFFQNEIMKSIKELNDTAKKPVKEFKLDFSGMDIPKSKNEFTSYWFNDPVSQGRTGTCWCFSTTSYFESEIFRLHNKKVKLSEMFTVYWEYVEKAKRFFRERGNSAFEEGSEANAVTRIWKMYGIVPNENYTGLLPEQKFHDHSAMHKEMKSYLE